MKGPSCYLCFQGCLFATLWTHWIMKVAHSYAYGLTPSQHLFYRTMTHIHWTLRSCHFWQGPLSVNFDFVYSSIFEFSFCLRTGCSRRSSAYLYSELISIAFESPAFQFCSSGFATSPEARPFSFCTRCLIVDCDSSFLTTCAIILFGIDTGSLHSALSPGLLDRSEVLSWSMTTDCLG